MKKTFVRCLNLFLAASLAALPLQAQSGMIGTGAAASAAQAEDARVLLRGAIDRAEAAGRLQAWGLTPQQAHARIAALTDAEAAQLASRAALPAGADGSGVGLIIIVAFLIWYFWVNPAMNPETKKEGKKK